MEKVTSTQPGPVKGQRIYGSQPVKPLDGASNQPSPLPNVTVHGVKKSTMIRVRIKASDSETVIRVDDFDPALHERLA